MSVVILLGTSELRGAGIVKHESWTIPHGGRRANARYAIKSQGQIVSRVIAAEIERVRRGVCDLIELIIV